MWGRRFALTLSLLIFLVFIPLAYMHGTAGFVPDALIFAAITLIVYWLFDSLRLNTPTFVLLNIGFVLHLCGIFGWYSASPLPIQWDHITHFVGLIPWTLLFLNFASQFMTSKWLTKKNFLLFLVVIAAAMGVGAVIELFEFTGYLALGEGDGALQFGDGDGLPGDTDAILALGGGWINMGWDLIYNSAGILTGLLIGFIVSVTAPKKKKDPYYFLMPGDHSRRT